MPNGRGRKDRGYPAVEEIAGKISSLERMGSFEAEALVEYGEKMGKLLAREVRLKTTQIRKFLDAVNKISAESAGEEEHFPFRERAILLKPKLAYAAGRQDEVKPLMKVLASCIDRVKDGQDFDKFARFVESIVAYHRYYGGKD